MKITIDKRGFRWDEADKALEVLKTHKENPETFSHPELMRMADLYIGCDTVKGVYDVNVSVSKNSNPLMESNESYDATIDTWIEMLVEGGRTCMRLGFYLNDYWTTTGDNQELVKSRAYIRKFVQE